MPERSGPKVLTTICGPTCMAYDRLTRIYLPANIFPGDHIVWHGAGAYHIPWETRFSRGYCRVLWLDENGSVKEIRRPESFIEWWGQWKKS